MTEAEGDDAHAGQFPVVGIGASAGGLVALQAFFDHVPAESGMAFVVIVHLDPDRKSHMAELLQSRTAMSVRQVTRSMKVEPNSVYIIPPDKDLALTDGHFQLTERSRPNRSRAPIDGFLRTLAETHSTGAAGIILSGTGSDGTQGIGWIKESGGLTMAQTPAEADHAGMPQSAIATGQVDVVLSASMLGPEVVRILKNEGARLALPGEEGAESEEELVGKALTLVGKATAHDFSAYRRITINRRIQRRVKFAHAEDLSEYLRILAAKPAEVQALYNDLLITVTSFFRDPEAFDTLAREVVPGLFAGKSAGDTIRVWVTGCATGEEAYSIAILLCEASSSHANPPAIQIFATDVHDRAFSWARGGLYSESIAADMSAERLDRFFSRESGGYRVKKNVREKVVFATHNLLRDPPFLRLDLVSCRNLLIYLQREAQRRVFELFHFALRPGATLFLGTSESVNDASKLFAAVNKKQRIFRALAVPETQVPRLTGRYLRPGVSMPRPADPLVRATDASAVHRKLVEAYAPPSLVVNSDQEVVHLSDGAGKFLELGGGEPTRHFLEMVTAEVRPRLRKLLSRALVQGVPGEVTGLTFTIGGKKRVVDVVARPVAGETSDKNLALVVFAETSAPESDSPPARKPVKAGTKAKATETRMAYELKESKAQNQALLEEFEGAIEELKASNEELQSINEEQRATEEELEASKEELQSINEELQTINQEFRSKNDELALVNGDLVNLIDSTAIATIFLDRQLRLRRFTPTVVALFNVLPSDLGRPLSDLTHRMQYPELEDDGRKVLKTLARVERDVTVDGGKWFTVSIAPYRSIDDRIDGVVITMVDVTDRKVSELSRESFLDDVQSASVAKSNFIGVMSHELRTPLNAILGYANVLQAGMSGPVNHEQAHHLERISACALHLARMIDDSLQSVRIEAGITTLENESVDVSTVVHEVAAAIEPLVNAKGLHFEVYAADGQSITADPMKLQQILYNLLGNALRFTDQGLISITSRSNEEGATIVIQDTGIGIAPDDLERVFDRFWQADQTKTRLRGGTGLGLMVSRSLARVMGGDIEVTSELGRGSRFVLTLPRGE